MSKATVSQEESVISEKRKVQRAKDNGQEASNKIIQESESKSPKRRTSTRRASENDVISTILESLGPEGSDEKNKNRDNAIKQFLKSQIESHEVTQQYNLLILYDEGRMVQSDANHIYTSITTFGEEKPLLLILFSTGGHVGSAYLIGKLCREYSKDKFVVVVPRQAKSAATLLCCAADEIHMGSLSELGPIDPQIENYPALGLKSSVEHIADLVKKYPHSAEMFARYLNYSLNPIHLGYYERVAESATQYAERLLQTHSENLKEQPSKIANELVYSYKDHGFVIDKSEAQDIFGEKIVKTNTKEYELGNSIYKVMLLISNVAEFMNHYFYFIGSCESNPWFRKKQ